MTSAPFFIICPTLSEAARSGSRLGRRSLWMGVGTQTMKTSQPFSFASSVLAAFQGGDAAGIDVEADSAGKMLRKAHRNRQTDIAKTDNCNFQRTAFVKICGQFTAAAITKSPMGMVNRDYKR